ncbi:hypothetical protein QE441_001011 [Chryseobacterium sp. SORGH_AS909]|uniref:DUF1129 domain-containing protein n=1 Tax=Chryseobacterium camelliae TaxID=1265445 RepID=A0ABU0TLD1_9FLAO|nr:hypothetical protein [Chryseobacterium camelliae]MDQ1101778.1 hypothetical protein [Chryseobacterium sp. SORGH_AS_1048]MDR6085217.1 hypothetical protein [Chryseobacterium sp. SORGH_AS_0909]MDR6129575.1 hypothetical protein [Chryseobacterium sp. SORGH_AS_1175]MDT3408299.1 hypothetical protein [Pseudacidovorax intermedius]
MRQEEILQIEQYLKKRKLSSQLYDEVLDHFIIQISENMDCEDISFQKAFYQVQLDWAYELEMVKADIFSFRKITRLEKNTLQLRFRNILISSLLISILAEWMSVRFPDTQFYVQIALLLTLTGFLIFNFAFRKMKFSDYIQLSFHPLLIRNIVLIFLCIGTRFFILPYLGVSKNLFGHIPMVFGLIVQIQLLYFNSKKINVLI